MSAVSPPAMERVAPRQQGNWDWRAASNFNGGGAGGGLLAWAALAAAFGVDARGLTLAALVLLAFGLTCVWFEIGRPLRALNAFRHFGASWMTREASLAPPLFVSGLLAAWAGHVLLHILAGALGMLFIYAQARILAADKGIAAWRHPLCQSLVVTTGVTEGAGLLLCAAPFAPKLAVAGIALCLLVMLRLTVWRRYRAGLAGTGAPTGTIRALAAIDRELFWLGSLVPAILALLAAASGSPPLAVAAGALAVLGGWRCKFTLICRAAFTQGFALPKMPVRGVRNDRPAGAIRPGWAGANDAGRK